MCFNETFSAGESGASDYTVLWHEALNGRKAGDVKSAFGQNKNWTLFTAFVLLVTQTGDLSQLFLNTKKVVTRLCEQTQ